MYSKIVRGSHQYAGMKPRKLHFRDLVPVSYLGVKRYILVCK